MDYVASILIVVLFVLVALDMFWYVTISILLGQQEVKCLGYGWYLLFKHSRKKGKTDAVQTHGV